MTPKIKAVRALALTGYFGLWAVLFAWFGFLEPSKYGIWLPLMICLPLLFPLSGLLRGNAYTYAWSIFIAMLYLTHSLTELWALEGKRWLPALETLFICMWSFGAGYYARWQGRALGLGIRKKKSK